MEDMVRVEKDCGMEAKFQKHLSFDYGPGGDESYCRLGANLCLINQLGPMRRKWKRLAREGQAGHNLTPLHGRKRDYGSGLDEGCESYDGLSNRKKGIFVSALDTNHPVEPKDGNMTEFLGLTYNLGSVVAFEHADREQ